MTWSNRCGLVSSEKLKGAISGGFCSRSFAIPWKASSRININENLKMMAHFLFRHHIDSVKLLISVFGHGWPGWKCRYNLKTFSQRFQVLYLYLAKLTEKLIMVCFPWIKFTRYLPLVFPGACCVCEWRYLIVIFVKSSRNASKILVTQPL